MANARSFTKKYADKLLAEHFGDDVIFEIDRIATKAYVVSINKAPEGFDAMPGLMALREAFRDYQFSLL